MAPKSRGLRRKYDWKQILAVLLCKGVWSFSDLERELQDIRYALRRSYIGKYTRNKDRYRRRRLGERPFRNAEKRSRKCYYRKNKEKGMKLYLRTRHPRIF